MFYESRIFDRYENIKQTISVNELHTALTQISRTRSKPKHLYEENYFYTEKKKED